MVHPEVQGELISLAIPIGTAYAIRWFLRIKEKCLHGFMNICECHEPPVDLKKSAQAMRDQEGSIAKGKRL